ncbi:MAG: archaetidylserine decarboxylase [Planctomycetota bacterium]
MTTPFRTALSHLVGWAADRRLPKALRPTAHRTFARLTGADLSEVRPPLDGYASVGAFFVRRLAEGARSFPEDPLQLGSPCDGRLQATTVLEGGDAIEAKGLPYSAEALLCDLHRDEDLGPAVDLDGARVITVYLSPRDYHRVHCPLPSVLERVRWAGGARFSVAPKVLKRRPTVHVENERAVLRLRHGHQPWFLVMVGALNVGRIRVVGVPAGEAEPRRRDPSFARGEELARFELGSTVVMVLPQPTATFDSSLSPGAPVRMGQPLARLTDGWAEGR